MCRRLALRLNNQELIFMAHKTLNVSLPEELFEIVEKARAIEHRSRSEIVQEAIRRYFGEPVYVPTEDERRLLDRAVAEVERDPDAGGSLQEVREDLQSE